MLTIHLDVGLTKSLPRPIHFDDSEHLWSIGAIVNALDVETVALHEIGHILGLEHTSVTSAVMYRYGNTNFTQRSLEPDDIAGNRSLYSYPPAAISWVANRLDIVGVGTDEALP
jgi:Matrixin